MSKKEQEKQWEKEQKEKEKKAKKESKKNKGVVEKEPTPVKKDVLIAPINRSPSVAVKPKDLHELCKKTEDPQKAIDQAAALFKSGIGVNPRNNLNQTPLHIAVEEGQSQMVHFLLNQPNIDINVVDMSGNTPLHLAAKCIEIEIAKQLVNAGANREVKNNFGKIWLEMVDKRWAQGKMFDDALYETVKNFKEANPEKEEVLLIKREPSKRVGIQSKRDLETGKSPSESLQKAQSKRLPQKTMNATNHLSIATSEMDVLLRDQSVSAISPKRAESTRGGLQSKPSPTMTQSEPAELTRAPSRSFSSTPTRTSSTPRTNNTVSPRLASPGFVDSIPRTQTIPSPNSSYQDYSSLGYQLQNQPAYLNSPTQSFNTMKPAFTSSDPLSEAEKFAKAKQVVFGAITETEEILTQSSEIAEATASIPTLVTTSKSLKKIKEELLSLNSILNVDSYTIIAETSGDKLNVAMLYVTDEIVGLLGILFEVKKQIEDIVSLASVTVLLQTFVRIKGILKELPI